MGAKARGIALITHVPDEKVLRGVLEVEIRFEQAELHHAGTEAVSDQDDAGILFQINGSREDRCNGEEETSQGCEKFSHLEVWDDWPESCETIPFPVRISIDSRRSSAGAEVGKIRTAIGFHLTDRLTRRWRAA